MHSKILLQSSLVTLLAMGLAACSTGAKTQTQATANPAAPTQTALATTPEEVKEVQPVVIDGEKWPARVYDAHIHTRFDGKPERSSGIIVSLEELQKEMKEARVVGALSMTADFMKDYPDLSSNGIKYCAGLREKIDYKRLEEKLKNKEYACIKIYLGYVHRWAYDAAYQPAYKLAEKYGVPVVFHTGDTYSTVAKLKYSDPLTIDEVAVTYPNVKFVIAHMGNPWIQSAAEVAYKNPNVYVEGSAFFAGPMSEYPAEKVATQMVAPIKWVFDYIENPKKVLFGTDWPLVPTKDYVGAFKKAIPEKYWDLVFYQNAIDVYQPEKSKILVLKLTEGKTDRKLAGNKTKNTKKSQSPLKK